MSNPWSKSFEDLRNSIDEAATSYLEKDMKKRQKNNEKARKDMEKMGSMKNPHFGSGPTGSMSSEETESVDEGLSGERYKAALKKGKQYSRRVSADPAKRATRGGRGGESDFGAGDRGAGNKAARRAGTYQEEQVENIDENRAAMGRINKEYHRKKESDEMEARSKSHKDKMKNDPEYAAKRKKADEVIARMGKGNPMVSKEEVEVDEAMSSYDRNRKRAAQRAAERNAARAAGKTGVVPGVGYVSPRKERETYVDSAGTTRHKSGAKMEGLDPVGHEDKDIDNDGDHDKSDKYLLKRRKAIGKAMKNQKEDWRSSLGFIDEAGCSDDEDKKDMKKIGKGEVKNKVTVMPNVKMGKQNEEVEQVDEKYQGMYQSPKPTATRVLSKDKKATMSPARRAMQRSDELEKSEPGSSRAKAQKKASMQMARNFQSARATKESANLCPVCGYEPCQCPPEQRIGEEKDPCWDTHKQVGMKKKGGKMVPNCVPKTKSEELDFYLDETKSGSLFRRIKEASKDQFADKPYDKFGRYKDPKARKRAQEKASALRTQDRRSGRKTYGSKLGYDKKDWDE